MDDEIIIDKFEVDLKNKKVSFVERKKTRDLRKWFDEEIGYKALEL